MIHRFSGEELVQLLTHTASHDAARGAASAATATATQTAAEALGVDVPPEPELLMLMSRFMPSAQCPGSLHATYTADPGASDVVSSVYEPDEAAADSVVEPVKLHADPVMRTTLCAVPDQANTTLSPDDTVMGEYVCNAHVRDAAGLDPSAPTVRGAAGAGDGVGGGGVGEDPNEYVAPLGVGATAARITSALRRLSSAAPLEGARLEVAKPARAMVE